MQSFEIESGEMPPELTQKRIINACVKPGVPNPAPADRLSCTIHLKP